MHKHRVELQATLKHALFYIGRFLMQAMSNFWQTVKGQQILQLSVCAFISLIYNINLGIIEWDKASVNAQSVMYFCGTLFILVVLMGIVTAPFHLDREREESALKLKGNEFDSTTPLVKVRNRNFTNEKIMLNGFDYKNCKFINVKFVYNGTGIFRFSNNTISGIRNFSSGNPSVFATIYFLNGGLGLLQNTILRGENEEPLDNVKPITVIN